MFFIKNLISVPLTILGYFFYQIFKVTPKFIYHSFVRSYCYSNGRIIDFLKIIDDLILKKDKFFKYKLNKNLNFNLINKNLKEKGYYIFPYKLESKTINDLINLSKNQTCFYFNDKKKKKFCKFYKKSYSNKYESFKYSYSRAKLIESKVIRKILQNNNYLFIAYNYFKNRPYFSNIDMWWSTARGKKPTIKSETTNKSAHFFHFDLDRPKWLKLFIYLSDVDNESGPHEYVEGSHNVYSKPKKILSKGYTRISSNEIKKFYKKNKIKKILGKKGTMFIADTSSFHRGIPPQKKNRLILVIEYSNSLFGAKNEIKIKNKFKLLFNNLNLIFQ